MIEEVKIGLADHTAKGALLKKDPAVATAEDKDKDKDKDKGKQRQVSEDPSETVGSDDGDLPHSPAADEHGKKRGALQHRLRECRLTLHKAKFLQGDIYHILGVPQSEDEAYGAAEKIRHDLLKGEPSKIVYKVEHFDIHIYQAQGKMRSAQCLNSHKMRPRST